MIKLNGYEIKPTIFPDKTSQVWKIEPEAFSENGYNLIQWVFENEAEFLHVAQLVDLVKYVTKPFTTKSFITLDLPYLPYARQDKYIKNDQTFALRTFAKLVNSLYVQRVICFDAHSKLAYKIINNFIDILPKEEIGKARVACGSCIVCLPDAGAVDRYYSSIQGPVLCGEKTRDQQTGHITDYKVIGNAKDQIILIVDDLCDGGMTFILLSEKLYKLGAKEVHLYCSHGIFSKGVQVLRDAGILRIFTKEGEVE